MPFAGHSWAIIAATSVSSVLSPDTGALDGSVEGTVLGIVEGAVLGATEGAALGSSLGSAEGSSDGASLGSVDTSVEGAVEGSSLGEVEGTSLGVSVGVVEFHGLGGGVIAPPKLSHPAHPSSIAAARMSAKTRLIVYYSSPISCSAVTPIAFTASPWNSKYSDAPSLSAFDAGRM